MSNETVISSANARIKAMHRFRGQDPTNYSTPVKKRWDAKFGLAGLGNELALNADLDSVGRRVRVKNTSGGALGKGSLVAVAGAKLTAQTTGTASNNPVAGTGVTITIAGTWEAGQLVRVESGGYTDYGYISSIGSGFIVVDILMYAHTTPVVTAEPAYEITLADADGSNAAEWVLPADIADGAYGYAYDCCEVSGLDTSALTAEALVYLSATAGGYTATAPTGSDQIQQVVGIVKSSHASTGSILFIPGLKRILKLGSSCLQSGVGGGISDGDKGDVTVSSSGTVWTIDNGVVTFAKMANMTTDRLVGRDTAGSGAPEEISVGGGVEFTGSGGIQRSALTGDVTATAGSNTTTIANSAVTFAKFQNISTDKLLGRDTASSGVVEEIGLTGGLEFDGAGSIRIADAGITTTKVVDANITFAKIQSASAASRLLGRGSASGAGSFEEITLGGGLSLAGTVLSAGGVSDGDKGDVNVSTGGTVWAVQSVSGSFALEGDLQTTISGTNNDFNPSGFSSATTVRVTASGAGAYITGLSGGADGRIVVIINDGSFFVCLDASSTASSAVNRFLFQYSVILTTAESCVVQYDAIAQRWKLISKGFGLPYIRCEETQTSGTNGGGSTGGSTHNRAFVTESVDTHGIAALSGGAITLEPGTYRIDAWACGFKTGEQKLRLYNSSTTTYVLEGESGYNDSAGNTQTNVRLSGTFTVTSSSHQYTLRHYIAVTKASNGLGVATSQGTEVFARVELWKLQ